MTQEDDPRTGVWRLIEEDDVDSLLDKAARLHGHYCPGLALGVKAAFEAVKEMGLKSEGMEDVLAIVETNNCSTDGIQFVTGCTFGNNSLIFRDLGKTAFTLARRDGEGVRFVTRKDAGENWNGEFPEYERLFEKIVKEREGTEEDKERFSRLAREVSHHVVNVPAEKLFKVEDVMKEIPEYAPIHESYVCDRCGESVMATRTVEEDGSVYCLSCSSQDFNELTGYGIVRG